MSHVGGYDYKHVTYAIGTADAVLAPYLLDGWKIIAFSEWSATLERRKPEAKGA